MQLGAEVWDTSTPLLEAPALHPAQNGFLRQLPTGWRPRKATWHLYDYGGKNDNWMGDGPRREERPQLRDIRRSGRTEKRRGTRLKKKQRTDQEKEKKKRNERGKTEESTKKNKKEEKRNKEQKEKESKKERRPGRKREKEKE